MERRRHSCHSSIFREYRQRRRHGRGRPKQWGGIHGASAHRCCNAEQWGHWVEQCALTAMVLAPRGDRGVTVSGTPASVTFWSSSAVNFVIPAGAVTDNVVLTTSAGLTSNNLIFTIVPPPSISSLSPVSGAANATVTINGSNFGSLRGTGSVYLWGQECHHKLMDGY